MTTRQTTFDKDKTDKPKKPQNDQTVISDSFVSSIEEF